MSGYSSEQSTYSNAIALFFLQIKVDRCKAKIIDDLKKVSNVSFVDSKFGEINEL